MLEPCVEHVLLLDIIPRTHSSRSIREVFRRTFLVTICLDLRT